MQQILLVEDDEDLRRGISYKLAKEGYHILTASTLKDAYELLGQQPIDLIICDIGLPDGSGLDFCRRVRQSSKVLFLFLTAMDSEMDMVEGYDVGADDYITKPFSMMVFSSKINAMMGRAAKTRQNALRSGGISLYLEEGRAEKDGQPLSLSPNEWKLLCHFMQNPRRVFSKSKLLSALWENGSDYMDENNVAVNIRRLREKIEDDPSAPSFIKNVRGIGYIWSLECEKL